MKPIVTLVLGGVAASLIAAPAAAAAEPCSASNLASVGSGVLNQAGG